MAGIFDLLERDHEKAKSVIADILKNQEEAKREELFGALKSELEVHMTFEEEVVYPAIRDAVPDSDEEIDDGIEEHKEARGLLAKLQGMEKTDKAFDKQLEELKGALEHHIDDEEEEVFPQAREHVDEKKQKEMGEAYGQRKQKRLGKAA